jgi:hypothetical protein
MTEGCHFITWSNQFNTDDALETWEEFRCLGLCLEKLRRLFRNSNLIIISCPKYELELSLIKSEHHS